MKAILLSIKPEWLVKILNGEKTIEIRKKFPKDYVGWIYLYCSKGTKNERIVPELRPDKVYHPLTEKISRGVYAIIEEDAIWNDCKKYILNGKVVARFWCDKVEEMRFEDNGGFYETALQRYEDSEYFTDSLIEEEICEKSCLECYELEEYLKGKGGFAIHISKLEIFGRPKELSEFYTTNLDKEIDKLFDNSIQLKNGTWVKPLNKAPQNYCYVEGE